MAELFTPQIFEKDAPKVEQDFKHLFKGISANMTVREEYRVISKNQKCLLDIYFSKKGKQIDMTFSEAQVTHGMCFKTGQKFALSLHEKTTNDLKPHLTQVWLFCAALSFFFGIALVASYQEKSRTVDALERRYYGDQHTHGSAVSLYTATLWVIWLYLMFSVLLNTAFSVDSQWYIFVVPGVVLAATLCY